jgi:hypothetical protein
VRQSPFVMPNFSNTRLSFKYKIWRHDTQHNDTQQNNIHHNVTQHKGLICNTQHKCHSAIVTFSTTIICYYAECHSSECRMLFMIMLNVITLSFIMLSVIMLNVVAPKTELLKVVISTGGHKSNYFVEKNGPSVVVVSFPIFYLLV